LGHEASKRATVLAFDMLDDRARDAAVKTVMKLYGRVDVMVLNAGQYQTSVAWETPDSTVRRILDVNLISVVMLAKAVVPHMIERGGGQLVVTSSLAGKMGECIVARVLC